MSLMGVLLMLLASRGSGREAVGSHSVTGRLLLQSALGLLTALGSVHWRQQPTSGSVNAVCRGVDWGWGDGGVGGGAEAPL